LVQLLQTGGGAALGRDVGAIHHHVLGVAFCHGCSQPVWALPTGDQDARNLNAC
ncbi:MAG: hypothetical protein RIS58_631, partial [Actinomycetota bacterium]